MSSFAGFNKDWDQIVQQSKRMGVSPNTVDDDPAYAEPIVEIDDASLEYDPKNNPFGSMTVDHHESLYEKIFGEKLWPHLPEGIEHMTPVQRQIVKGNIMWRNVTIRAGASAARMFGAIGVEDYEGIRALDGARAAEQLSALKDLEGERELTDDEAGMKEVLEQDAKRWWQKGPEFTGGGMALAASFSMSSGILQASGLNAYLSVKGTQLMASKIPKVLEAATKSTALKDGSNVAARTLYKIATETPAALLDMFGTGVIAPGDEAGVTERLVTGVEMMPWAALSFAGPAFAKSFKETGKVIPGPAKELFNLAATKVAGMTHTTTQPLRKAQYVKRVLKEWDEAYMAENKREHIPKAMLDEGRRVLKEMVEMAAKVPDGEDLVTVMRKNVADGRAMEPVKPVAEVVSEIAENMATDIAETTRLMPVRMSNGKYSIQDMDSQVERARGVDPENLSKVLETLNERRLAGKLEDQKLSLRRTGKKVAQTLDDRIALRKRLREFQTVANDAYKAGKLAQKETDAIKFQVARAKLDKVKQTHRSMDERLAEGRVLVRDFVPAEHQGKFAARVQAAAKGDKMDVLVEQVQKYIDIAEVKSSVTNMRATKKSLLKKYGKDFDKAPDSTRPVLQALFAGVDLSKVTDPKVLDDIAGLHDEAVGWARGLRDGIETLKAEDIPEEVMDELLAISAKEPGTISALDIQFMDRYATLVARRAEIQNQLFIQGRWVKATEAINDSRTRVIDRKTAPIRKDQTGGFIELGIDIVQTESDHAITLVQKMTGRDSQLMGAFQELLDGRAAQHGVERRAIDIFQKYMGDNGISLKVLRGLESKKAVRIGNDTFQMSKDEILAISVALKDPYIFKQLTKPGASITIQKKKITMEEGFLDELFSMESHLSKEELKAGGVFAHYNTMEGSHRLNEISEPLNGLRIAVDPEHNYPIKRTSPTRAHGKTYGSTSPEMQTRVMERVGGNKSVAFDRGLMAEYLDNAKQIGRYNGTSMPLRNLNTIMNDEGFAQELLDKGYQKERDAFLQILRTMDDAGAKGTKFDTAGGKLLTNFAAGVLAGRISSIGTQMMSVPAFWAEIPAKYFAKSVPKVGAATIARIEKSSDFFWDRWNNKGMTVETGNRAAMTGVQRILLQKKGTTDIMMGGLTWGDKKAIGFGYNAAMAMAKDKGLGEQAAHELAVKILEKATWRTQPVWDALGRSLMSTDASLFKRSVMMFRTPQEAQYNAVKRGYEHWQRTGDKSDLISSTSGVVMANAGVAIWRKMWGMAKLSGGAGLAGWMGIHLSERDEENEFATMAKDSAKNLVSIVPGGKYLAEGTDKIVSMFMEDYEYHGYFESPYDVMRDFTTSGIVAIEKFVRMAFDDPRDNVGVTRYGVPIKAKDAEEVRLRDIIEDVVIPLLKGTLLATGKTGAAPIDEWIKPLFRESDHGEVKMIGKLDAEASDDEKPKDTVQLQRKVEKFMTKWKELTKKERDPKVGVNDEEQVWLKINQGTKMVLDGMMRRKNPDDLAIVDYYFKDYK